MLIFSTATADRHPVVVDDVTYLKSEWMKAGDDPAFSPTVFLVEQPPNVSLCTHFHRNNQFQLFVRGSGSLGPHPLDALTVHYAGAYSGYGPLVSGSEGLAYFTLRGVFESGSLTLAQHADQMKRGPKRQLHSKSAPIATAACLAGQVSVAVNDLIPLQPDAVAARLYTLPAYASHGGLDPAGSAGQFYVVMAGALTVGEQHLQAWQSVFVSAHEGPLQLVASGDGVQVVCVQMPVKAPEYVYAVPI